MAARIRAWVESALTLAEGRAYRCSNRCSYRYPQRDVIRRCPDGGTNPNSPSHAYAHSTIWIFHRSPPRVHQDAICVDTNWAEDRSFRDRSIDGKILAITSAADAAAGEADVVVLDTRNDSSGGVGSGLRQSVCPRLAAQCRVRDEKRISQKWPLPAKRTFRETVKSVSANSGRHRPCSDAAQATETPPRLATGSAKQVSATS